MRRRGYGVLVEIDNFPISSGIKVDHARMW